MGVGDLCIVVVTSLIHTGTHSSRLPPQLKSGAFVHMQSNGAVDGTEFWETAEAEGPPYQDHKLVPQRRQLQLFRKPCAGALGI